MSVESVEAGKTLPQFFLFLRIRRGFSQPKAAAGLGVSARYIQFIESGGRQPDHTLFSDMMYFYGFDPDEGLTVARAMPRYPEWVDDEFARRFRESAFQKTVSLSHGALSATSAFLTVIFGPYSPPPPFDLKVVPSSLDIIGDYMMDVLPRHQYKIPMFWITYTFFAHLFRQPQPIIRERTSGLTMPTKLDLLEELGRSISQENTEQIEINILLLITSMPRPSSIPPLEPGKLLPSVAKREQIRDVMEVARLLPPEKVEAIYYFTRIIGDPKFSIPSDKLEDFVGWLHSAIYTYSNTIKK